MAVLEVLPGLEVCVCIDDNPLEEYDDDEEDQNVKPGHVGEYQSTRTVRIYIESISDKEFSIRMKANRSYNFDSPGLSFEIFIYGEDMDTPLMLESNHPRKNKKLLQEAILVSKGAIGGDTGRDNRSFLKRYKFSKIETSTDDARLSNVKKDIEIMRQIGEIKVLVYRVSTRIVGSLASGLATAKSAGTVHEKALKGQAKSHSTSLGPPELQGVTWIDCEDMDGEDFPVAIFRFKYRSKEALKQLLVIERTPSPEPERIPSASAPPPALSLDNLNAEQKAQLERFLQGLVGNNRSSSPERRIKREFENRDGASGSRKKRRPSKMVTIDLTEDSDG